MICRTAAEALAAGLRDAKNDEPVSPELAARRAAILAPTIPADRKAA